MSDPNEWGDDLALQLASNVLGVDIVLITAFPESAVYKDLGLTIIKILEKSKIIKLRHPKPKGRILLQLHCRLNTF